MQAVEPDDDDPDEVLWQRWARGADLGTRCRIDHDPTVRPRSRTTPGAKAAAGQPEAQPS